MESELMTKASALYSFFSSFGLKAYEENSVYAMGNAPKLPYITYEMSLDSFEGNDVSLSFSLWSRSSSWEAANAKADEISKTIGRGKVIECDGGYILIHRGHPFSENLGDLTDDMIKRILCKITVRFYTND